MFQETVRQHGTQPAVGFKAGKEKEYTYWTYDELDSRVRRFARGLDALGLKKGDRLALLSENRAEWAVTDLAAQLLGLIVVAPFASLPAGQIAYLLRDSGAQAIVVSDAKQRAKIREIRADVPDLEQVIAMDGEPEKLEAENVIPFDAVIRRGEEAGADQTALDALAAAVHPDDVATFIYTSGTTGEPKGAMLTHANWLDTPDSVVSEPIAILGPGDVFLSFLPLSHITERVGGHYLPLRVGACIVYSQGLLHLAEEIPTTVRPTAMLCVPRLFENMYDKAKDRLAKEPERKRKIAEWALYVGTEIAERSSEGKRAGLLLGLERPLADRLALSKIRARLTGGRMRFTVSGGAPLDPEVLTFFLAIGVQILEGYGLSETNIIAINRPGRQRIGTVGNLMPNVQVKIADDGEILTRGPGLMKGYWNKPEETAEAIDSEGWFHTGDIGELSADGYLKITDRKKNILVLTNGKKVAPQAIEALLKHSPYIAEAVLFGDRQPTVSAILVPAFDALTAWAKSQELPVSDPEGLVAHPEVQKLYKAEVDRYAADLADFEKIKRFKLVTQPFGIESGELTPTLKVKRNVVETKYADLIAAMSR
jgi:long-chain acyl-CoA synthetase